MEHLILEDEALKKELQYGTYDDLPYTDDVFEMQFKEALRKHNKKRGINALYEENLRQAIIAYWKDHARLMIDYLRKQINNEST